MFRTVVLVLINALKPSTDPDITFAAGIPAWGPPCAHLANSLCPLVGKFNIALGSGPIVHKLHTLARLPNLRAPTFAAGPVVVRLATNVKIIGLFGLLEINHIIAFRAQINVQLSTIAVRQLLLDDTSAVKGPFKRSQEHVPAGELRSWMVC